MFSAKEKLRILKAIARVQEGDEDDKVVRVATMGMFPKGSSSEPLEVRLQMVLEAIKEGKEPIVHDDSTSGWMHTATSKFGLTVGDIRAMKFGDTIKVLMMDRNVGDYTSGMKKQYFNPAKVGFRYATYIHGENLTGMLNFTDVGAKRVPFEWEINEAAFNRRNECCNWNIIEGDEKDLEDGILVGWRGPAIDIKRLSELPSKIRLYDTWWDDYGVSKYEDWLRKK